MKNCWEIKNCGCEAGGYRAQQRGVCPAYSLQMGHSCWGVAGTLCDDESAGVYAGQGGAGCPACEVFRLYHRSRGLKGTEVAQYFPDEEQRCKALLLKRLAQA